MACVGLMPILNIAIMVAEMCRRSKPELAEMDEPKLPDFDQQKQPKSPKK
jgi:hypothetical protein